MLRGPREAEHEKPVDPATTLSGTDLKPVAQPTPEIVYAVPYNKPEQACQEA